MRFRIVMWTIILASVGLVATDPVQGHHSIAGFWSMDKSVSVTGIVSEVKLVNPHPSIKVEVMEGGQKVVYLAILRSSLPGLARYGLAKEMFPLGSKIILEGHPPKGAGTGKGIFVEAFTLENGKKINMSEG